MLGLFGRVRLQSAAQKSRPSEDWPGSIQAGPGLGFTGFFRLDLIRKALVRFLRGVCA